MIKLLDKKAFITYIDIIGFALVFFGAILTRVSNNFYMQVLGAILITMGAAILARRAGK